MTPPVAAVAEPLPRRRARPDTRRAPARRPRRISGPARPNAPAGKTQALKQGETRGLALRAFDGYERVADSALLDRLVRGRLWIGLLAFGLIGIVAMQLMVLKLNTGVGATLERAASLQRANAQLRIEAATGSGEGRIEPLAAATGMTFAPPGSVHFVAASPSNDIARAASVLSQPIQPHESVSPSSETAAVSGEGEASGTASPGAGEAKAEAEAASQASQSSSAGSAEASTSSESHGAEAVTSSTAEPEAAATAAGGVAAGR